MARTNNEIRKIFLRLNNQNKKPIEIANILGLARQTITNWKARIKNKPESQLLEIGNKGGKPSKLDIEALKVEFESNRFGLNREIAQKFGVSKSLIQYFRQRLGYTKKVANTTYKEADPELKKTLKKK